MQASETRLAPEAPAAPRLAAVPGGVSPRRALPRGPRTPRLFQSLRYSLWPYASLDISTRRYGDCYTAYPLGGPPMVVFTRVASAALVLVRSIHRSCPEAGPSPVPAAPEENGAMPRLHPLLPAGALNPPVHRSQKRCP